MQCYSDCYFIDLIIIIYNYKKLKKKERKENKEKHDQNSVGTTYTIL
jgi:hypothetical protein